MKKYAVFENIIKINDFMEEISNIDILIGFSFAESSEKAISNVKHNKNIKKKNYYEKDNYYSNCLEKHKFWAKEIIDEKEKQS